MRTKKMVAEAPAGLVGAVDIGGTKIAVGLLTRGGEVRAQRELTTGQYADGKAGTAAIGEALRACMAECGDTLSGIGVGCTGPVDPGTGVIGKVANLPGWEDFHLVEELARAFGVSTVMENDADAAAVAEGRWGSGRKVERFLYVTLSTGIGGGLLLHGEIYRGARGSHPELGHHTIDASGPLCYCRARGCWESLASGMALRDWYLANDAQARFRAESLSAREVFALFDRGDPLAVKAVARLSRYVGIGLANLTTMLVPDVIALGGGLTARADAFLPAAEAHFRTICGEVPACQTQVRLAGLRENAGLAGAAGVWLLANTPSQGPRLQRGKKMGNRAG